MKIDVMELPILQLYKEKDGKILLNYKVCKEQYKNQQAIVDYLKSGFIFGAYPEILYDAFSHKRIPYESIIYTDGKYRWTSELIYYVENYNLILPDYFVERALSNKICITEADLK